MADYTYDENIFSDLYKDTVGFRPRQHRFYHIDTTPAEKQEIWDSLLEDHAREMSRLEEAEVQADIDFEDSITSVIDSGAGDRETAIRWLIEAQCDKYDLMYGFSFISYELGISYKFQEEVQGVIDQLIDKAD